MKPLFEHYVSADMYEKSGVKYCIPMTAQEIETEEEQDEKFNSTDYYVEEKFDGTRATLHFFKDHARCFSRRISEKTGWFCENTDSLPQLRDLKIPFLEGTVIDGEMFIPDRPFKDVSSTLNCKWDKAIERQEELGNIVFHAFDILYYKGVCLEKVPLHRRKDFLNRVVKEINDCHVVPVHFFDNTFHVVLEGTDIKKLKNNPTVYPTLFKEVSKDDEYEDYAELDISKKAYYEYIVLKGGEGVILKYKNGKYLHKRGKEYLKVKKFLTREVIILGFSPPTKEYKGKAPATWKYWEDTKTGEVYTVNWDFSPDFDMMNDPSRSFIPVSKYYAEGWVGNIIYGVIITDEEISNLPKNKKFKISTLNIFNQNTSSFKVVEVGECSGFDEDQRFMFTSPASEQWVGNVIEVKANEIFKDTGKMRHPRFLRLRPDKSWTECTWRDHIGG